MASTPVRAEREKPIPAAARPAAAEDIRSTRPHILRPIVFRAALRRFFSIAALISIDLIGVTVGLYAALVLREFSYGQTHPLWSVLWTQAEAKWLPFLTLITVLVFWRNQLYAPREFRAGLGRIVPSLVLVALLTIAFGLGSGHTFHTFGLAPVAVAITAALIGLMRASYEVLTRDIFRLTGVQRRAVLVGVGEGLTRLHQTLGAGRGGIEYSFVGAVAPDSKGVDLPVLGPLESLSSILQSRRVDELIVTDSDFSENQLLEIVEQAHSAGVQVRIAPKTTELLTQRAEYVPGQGVPLFELRPPVFAGTDWVVKRTFDIVVSALVIVVGLPLWLAIAAAIKVTSSGPVFFRDRRIGLGEREFGMIKFRTMVQGAAAQQAPLEEANQATGALFKIRGDPRVTAVGKILRRLSVDEIPQVLNVLKGEMSLVGPRPLPVRDYQLLEDWHRKRYLVLPGMTGLWQISGSLSFDDLVRLDFYYLENWSIWLDISVLAKTLPALLMRKSAF